MPVKLIWGDDEYNIEKTIRKARKELLDDNFGTINHKKFNEPPLRDLIDTLQCLPMAFGNLLIEIYSTNLFLRKQNKNDDSPNDNYIDDLINIIENLNENVYVYFICQLPHDNGKKVDSAKKIVKTIAKTGKIEEYKAFKYYDTDKVVNWIIKTTNEKGYKISNQAAALLRENTGNELIKLNSEIEKLTLIADKKEITLNAVKELTSTHENIFIVLDYWVSGQKNKAMIELNKLFERDHPLKTLSTLNTTIRKWIKLKTEAQTKSKDEIAQIMKMHPYAVQKELEKVENVPIDKLIAYKNRLTKAETDIKSGNLSQELAIELAIIL